MLIEVAGYRRFTFPLIVLGSNSLFVYSISIMLAGWMDRAVGVFTGHFRFIGDLAPVAQALAVVMVMWCLCYWLFKHRIYLKF